MYPQDQLPKPQNLPMYPDSFHPARDSHTKTGFSLSFPQRGLKRAEPYEVGRGGGQFRWQGRQLLEIDCSCSLVNTM